MSIFHRMSVLNRIVKIIIQFGSSVVSDSLQPHGMQHARFPCPLLTPRASSNSCPSGRWCHPTISFSIILFSSCLQSFPGSGSFPVNQFFTSGGQSTGVSASASNEYSGLVSFRIDWFDLLAVQGTLKSLFQPHFKSLNSSALCFFYSPALTSINDYYVVIHIWLHD